MQTVQYVYHEVIPMPSKKTTTAIPQINGNIVVLCERLHRNTKITWYIIVTNLPIREERVYYVNISLD